MTKEQEECFPPYMLISEKYADRVLKKCEVFKKLNLSESKVVVIDKEDYDQSINEALKDFNLVWPTENHDLLMKLLFLAGDMSKFINKASCALEEEVKIFSDEEQKISKYMFIRMVCFNVHHIFMELRMGTFDSLEETEGMFLISKFAYTYCSDIIYQLNHTIIEGRSFSGETKH